MSSLSKAHNITGLLMFIFAATVYILSAEPTTSLWDCGEFISAAYKLEVVHPPGAPLFLMIGRLFSWVGTLFSDNPSNVAYAINVMSGISTAFLVVFVTWSTMILAKLSMFGRDAMPETREDFLTISGAGVIAGLSTTFATSVWFSAVEGEVYALSSFFTGLVVWASLRWYVSTHKYADRWLVFIAYMIGLSIGVHLLSLLAFPFLGVLFYFKRVQPDEDFNLKGFTFGFLGGFLGLCLIQYFIIPVLPKIASGIDFFCVNSIGLPMGTGILLFIILLISGIVAAMMYAQKMKKYYLHLSTMMVMMIFIGFSSYGMVVIRASADTAINMNDPSDPFSLLSYLNREQYGDRPLLYGPHFAAQRDDANPYEKDRDVYRPIEQEDGSYKYEKVDEKVSINYRSSDMMLFPRLGHSDRAGEYAKWMDLENSKPSFAQNIGFFLQYQIGYMYGRYFAWNFIGRQNAQQGTDGNKKFGNWLSGVGMIDNNRLYDQSNLPEYIKNNKARATFYFIPFILGLFGLLFHFKNRKKEAYALAILFLMTGLAIIVFSNQPPREPRERDYVLVGSIFTFCMWIGMAVPALVNMFKSKIGNNGVYVAVLLCLTAPYLMGSQNWKSMSRSDHFGARDYAINFLESCAPNAIVFTYGDNDTYPLWYVQEVEGIRTDVRVVNFSLLAVDWYINQLRRKINNSPKIEMTIPESGYKGKNRNYIPIQPLRDKNINITEIIDYVAVDQVFPNPQMQQFKTLIPANKAYINIDKQKARENGAFPPSIPDSLLLDRMEFNLKSKGFMMKDEIALLDIIATNAKRGWERPIYFAVTCRADKMMGLRNYLNLEGLALRIVPFKTPPPGNTGMPIMMGRVDTDLMFANMVGTEDQPGKFRWGNFDKEDLFIDESYMPSVQSLQYSLLRLTDALARENKKDKAVATIMKMFEAFPHFNFPLGENRIAPQLLNYLINLGKEDLAYDIMRQMTDDLVDRQNFYNSLYGSSDQQIFAQEMNLNMSMIQQLVSLTSQLKDEDVKVELQDKLSPFMPSQLTPEQQ